MAIYSLKEIYYTIQGEGRHTGRAAIFCRFAGCNLWNGREKDRESAKCSFCDTDFVGTDGLGGGVYEDAKLLVLNIMSKWDSSLRPLVVLTGGEPLLQVDNELINELKYNKCEIAIETNGTILAPEGIDWICVSPKIGTKIIQNFGDELKIVFPQKGLDIKNYEKFNFKHFSLQPMDGKLIEQNTKLAVEFCMKNPKWKLSLQTHKIIGIS
tara:strand:- start:103 stop:735 length:633 start_codon:yes stop_codon:yes gene_type:complete